MPYDKSWGCYIHQGSSPLNWSQPRYESEELSDVEASDDGTTSWKGLSVARQAMHRRAAEQAFERNHQ